jgi:hypothetical protein
VVEPSCHSPSGSPRRQGTLFFGTFFNPANPPSNDLWEIKLAPDWRTATTHPAIRQLTHDGDDGWITPEFSFTPDGTRLLWTELKIYDGVRIDSRNNPGIQVNQTLGFLMAPPGGVDVVSGVLSGGQFFYVTERTRMGYYASP